MCLAAFYGGRTVDVLKMNFSVGVNMYSAKVTSYWYRLRCDQRISGEAKEEFLDGSKIERTSRRKGSARMAVRIVVVDSIVSLSVWKAACCKDLLAVLVLSK